VSIPTWIGTVVLAGSGCDSHPAPELLLVAAAFQLFDGFADGFADRSSSAGGRATRKTPMLANFVAYWLIGPPGRLSFYVSS